jgi:hypothetical protein
VQKIIGRDGYGDGQALRLPVVENLAIELVDDGLFRQNASKACGGRSNLNCRATTFLPRHGEEPAAVLLPRNMHRAAVTTQRPILGRIGCKLMADEREGIVRALAQLDRRPLNAKRAWSSDCPLVSARIFSTSSFRSAT